MDTEIRAAVRRAIDAGQTIGDLADRADMTRPQLSRFLSGKKTLTTATATQLLAAIGLRPKLVPTGK